MKFFAGGLLFDNDGVLVDSMPIAEKCWNLWAQEFGVEGFDIEEHAGRRASDIVLSTVGPELFEQASKRIDQIELETTEGTPALPGAINLLKSLKPGTWTVCTSAFEALGRGRLAAAGLPIPAQLVTGDDVQNGKPAPDPYLLGAERLGFDIADCVIFEDAQLGVEAGQAAGAGLIVGVGKQALATEADIVISELTGITFDGETLVIPDKSRLR